MFGFSLLKTDRPTGHRGVSLPISLGIKYVYRKVSRQISLHIKYIHSELATIRSLYSIDGRRRISMIYMIHCNSSIPVLLLRNVPSIIFRREATLQIILSFRSSVCMY